MGRAGIEFIQSLFDGHSQILQMPGIIRFDKRFINSLELNAISFIDSFTKNNEHFFDSRMQKLERHNQLGYKKNEYYEVNKEKFKKNFLNIYCKTKKKKN
jgi:hypothetical protein